MKPIKRSIVGSTSVVVPLSTYGEVGVAWYATASVTVSALADRNDANTKIETPAAAATGSFTIPCDALLVVTTGNTDITIVQYGD